MCSHLNEHIPPVGKARLHCSALQYNRRLYRRCFWPRFHWRRLIFWHRSDFFLPGSPQRFSKSLQGRPVAAPLPLSIRPYLQGVLKAAGQWPPALFLLPPCCSLPFSILPPSPASLHEASPAHILLHGARYFPRSYPPGASTLPGRKSLRHP